MLTLEDAIARIDPLAEALVAVRDSLLTAVAIQQDTRVAQRELDDLRGVLAAARRELDEFLAKDATTREEIGRQQTAIRERAEQAGALAVQLEQACALRREAVKGELARLEQAEAVRATALERQYQDRRSVLEEEERLVLSRLEALKAEHREFLKRVSAGG